MPKQISHRWAALRIVLLTATILVRYDTMELLVYVEPGGEVQTAADFVANACDVAQSMDLALPTPYRIQWRRRLPSGAIVPDDSHVTSGMLTEQKCAST